MFAGDKQCQSVMSLDVLLCGQVVQIKPGCHVVTVSDHPGDICDLRLDRRGVGRTEGVCVSVSLQHPPIPRHTAPHDGLLHCHGESHVVMVKLLHCHGESLMLSW